jgi:hypothetical protein
MAMGAKRMDPNAAAFKKRRIIFSSPMREQSWGHAGARLPSEISRQRQGWDVNSKGASGNIV